MQVTDSCCVTQNKDSFYMYLEDRRRQLCDELDSVERRLGIEPTTAQIRRWYKERKGGIDK